MYEINKRIKEIRTAKKLSQTEFGEKIGLSRDAIANIENERVEVKDLTINMICKTYCVSDAWLRTGEGKPFAEMSMEAELTELFSTMLVENDVVKKEVIRMLLSIPPSHWQVLRNEIAKALAEQEKENPASE